MVFSWSGCSLSGAEDAPLHYDPGQLLETPASPLLSLPVLQSHPLPLPLPQARSCSPALHRSTPLFWAMHRGRGGMQYAMRIGGWKLLGGYGTYSDRGYGPPGGGDVVPWLRTVRLGRVELYLLSHDPAERVDLSAVRPDVVALMLPRMVNFLHEVAKEGPATPGWMQRAAPCPRIIRSLNVTEYCCQSRPANVNADEDIRAAPAARQPVAQGREHAHGREAGGVDLRASAGGTSSSTGGASSAEDPPTSKIIYL